MLCTVCVIVHGREKWVAHTDTLCSIIGEKNRTMSKQVPKKSATTGLMLEALETTSPTAAVNQAEIFSISHIKSTKQN